MSSNNNSIYTGGKGGKLGKLGKLAKRHQKKKQVDPMYGWPPAIRRLARRAGIKRMSAKLYVEMMGVIRKFLTDTCVNALTYCEYGRRQTLTPSDVIFGLQKLDRPIRLYGYESGNSTARGTIVNGTIKDGKKKKI